MTASCSTVDLENLFQALSDRTRLRLLNLMSDQEICVCYFVEVLGEPQSKISRHLACLRRAGLVAARREGKWMHYRLLPPPSAAVAKIVRETIVSLRDDRLMQADRTGLEKACCHPERSIGLAGAPVPARVCQ